MTDAIHFLTTEQLLAIHQRMIDEFGGSAGVRDHGLMESAAAMPAATFGGQFLHDGIPAMAAAYLFHLCKNHPFVDGNKRTALAAALAFLMLNGYVLTATKDEAENMTLSVADSSVSKEAATAFFQSHVRAEKSRPKHARREEKPKRRRKHS